MENASKALIMAAEILLGVMILSIAVYMFKNYAEYSSSTYSEIEATQIAEFNSKFLKFQGEKVLDDGSVAPVECTIHDIVSLANLAQKHNFGHELIEEGGTGNNSYRQIAGITTDNSLYVQIDLQGESNNLELKTNSYLVSLIKAHDLEFDPVTSEPKVKYFRCLQCDISADTGRVNYMRFQEI